MTKCSLIGARARQTLTESQMASQAEIDRLRGSEAYLSQRVHTVMGVFRSVENSRMYKLAEKARALRRDWPRALSHGCGGGPYVDGW